MPGDIVCSELSANRLKFTAFLPEKARFSPEIQNYITQNGKSDIGGVIFLRTEKEPLPPERLLLLFGALVLSAALLVLENVAGLAIQQLTEP